MTGVVKSNRCGTCRDRKIKCDEVQPVCGPCHKGKRICKDPISKVKFARPKGISPHVARESESLIETLPRISIVRSIFTTEGSSFQTLRIGRRRRALRGVAKPDAYATLPLLRPPKLSSVESLQLAMLQSFKLDQPGLRLSVMAGFMEDVPRMLGQSTAFDDSISCLVNCHGLTLRGQRPAGDIAQGHLYATALLSLQTALRDSVESYSDLTLGAVTILGYVEVFGGGSRIPQSVQHAGGACKLIEVRGPSRPHSNFTKVLYMAQRGQSVVVSIMRNESCFFSEPEWKRISYDNLYDRESDFFIDELLREFTALPALLVNVRAFYYSPDEIVSYGIYLEALRLRESLVLVTDFVNQKLRNGHDIAEGPPTLGDTFLTKTYQFSSRELAHVCTFSWGVSIIINTIIARFLPANTTASVVRGLQEQCLFARQRIFMSCKYSQQFRPFGTQYLAAPLIIAYRGATVEEKTWIMHQLWQIGELMTEVEVVWGSVSLEYASKLFYGESIVLPSGRGDSEDRNGSDFANCSYMMKVRKQWEQFNVANRVLYWEGKNA
ncbi:uncharacterized protein CC84DRAFT_1255741 [Paraphaeosphaeria sporulosa]|uniref:Zn(2)-C6 fungal-type domain-containing protein n=1 Tax=Paraphaeosphaeria sporulosa TaxID=1460663 RepID=A0A177CR45_9PLEO|nr:uncharacterized protein CC84DRAFT_1255741 [Paraphaeosphaeria sporulosa]OAG09776.1 hypothetical protein CC84DRAFT_1255741 [Paraphaeosphaeria sporulosa]